MKEWVVWGMVLETFSFEGPGRGGGRENGAGCLVQLQSLICNPEDFGHCGQGKIKVEAEDLGGP